MTIWRRLPLARRDDQGSGTVLLLALVAVALVVAAMLGLLASAQLGRGHAQTAADLGALAGAGRLLAGEPGDPCVTVAEAVRRNGARLSSCTDEGGGVVRVRVVVSGAAGSATASARAGPASARR
ncbi:Rv3654c family TadE-like protein [Cellulomonas sp. Leaf334]|uniref:Rv3654c family TadE-like protein n=1 Tax=Cellulomonas sp. Leaf334 TaxID=1736339 RepID=UPI0006FB3A56|nr:Rv3654c family TadE-like protein [Cellulomonas sp. Leaf334]KQR17115.1 hypothetical protein ASF78_07325 [Cellulomonas sp. Leaf334]